jgi:hypothetical protein
MTPVRTRRGKLVHILSPNAGDDGPNLLCGRRLKSLIIEPDAQPTCDACVSAMTTN